MDKNRVWCPASDEYKRGQCFTKKQVKAVSKVIKRELCSDIPQISANLSKDIRMFTCPYKTSCGRDNMAIVPSFDEDARSKVLVYSNFKKFNSKAYCRHEISFPIDATFGDVIQINVTNL